LIKNPDIELSVKIGTVIFLKKQMIYGEESPSIFVKLSDPMRTQFQNEILLTLEACQDSSLNN